MTHNVSGITTKRASFSGTGTGPFTHCTLSRCSMAVLLIGVLFGATGCAQVDEEEGEQSDPLYFETVGRGHTGTVQDTLEFIVRDADTWRAVQEDLRPLAEFEEVEFTQALIALIALPAESGGYTIEVESVESLNNVITVSYLVSEPGPDCITPEAEALPFLAVMIRKFEGEAEFVRRTERYKCGL